MAAAQASVADIIEPGPERAALLDAALATAVELDLPGLRTALERTAHNSADR